MRIVRASLAGAHDADVCVVGGGLTGCAAARELAGRGLRTVVLEAGAIASGASAASLGHVAVGLGCHYTTAALALGRDGAREVWETHRENHERLSELLLELKVPCGYQPRGGFALALDREEALALAESEDLLREDGFSGEFFDHYMFEARFDVRGFAGAYWSADDGEIDSAAFVGALAQAAEHAGATIFEGSPVRALRPDPRGVRAETPSGHVAAGLAVVALDAYAPALVPFLAERIRPRRGQCLALRTNGASSVPSPAYAGRGRVYWRADGDLLRIGGFDDPALAEESTSELGTTPILQQALEAFARERFPGADGSVIERWSGIMGLSRDGFPFVGPIPGEPLVAAAGFAGHGYGYALLAARWAAEFAATGVDKTPARYRAARPFTPGPWPPGSPSS